MTGSVEAGLGGNQHAKIMQNFCMAILDPAVTLISPGTDGMNGVELANSMVLSGLRGGEKISLPMDSADFARELRRLVAESPASAGQAEAFAGSASPVAATAPALASSD